MWRSALVGAESTQVDLIEIGSRSRRCIEGAPQDLACGLKRQTALRNCTGHSTTDHLLRRPRTGVPREWERIRPEYQLTLQQTLRFTAGVDGGVAISKYQYRVGSGAWTDAVGTTSPITITGLTNYQTSMIRLRAVNSAGASTPSVAVTVRPKLTGPTIGVAYSSGKNGVQVGFAFTRAAGSTLAGFTVRAYAKGTTTVVSSCPTTGNGRGCYVGSLLSGTEYDIRVQGYLTVSGDPKVRETLESATSRVRVNS